MFLFMCEINAYFINLQEDIGSRGWALLIYRCSEAMLNYSITTGTPSSQISIPLHTVVRKLRNSPNLTICLGNFIFLSLKNTKKYE